MVAVAEDRQHRWMAVADRRGEALDAVLELGAQVGREGPPVEQPGRHPSRPSTCSRIACSRSSRPARRRSTSSVAIVAQRVVGVEVREVDLDIEHGAAQRGHGQQGADADVADRVATPDRREALGQLEHLLGQPGGLQRARVASRVAAATCTARAWRSMSVSRGRRRARMTAVIGDRVELDEVEELRLRSDAAAIAISVSSFSCPGRGRAGPR